MGPILIKRASPKETKIDNCTFTCYHDTLAFLPNDHMSIAQVKGSQEIASGETKLGLEIRAFRVLY